MTWHGCEQFIFNSSFRDTEKTKSLSGITGTVSRDIAFYFKVYQFKSVLSVRLLMVFKLIYFVALQIFETPANYAVLAET
jgi:hypothetical protein